MGDTPIELLAFGDRPDAERADRLAALIAGNLEHPAGELMWGSPGTLLATLFLHERTCDTRWEDLLRRTAAKLWSQLLWSPEHGCPYWTQDLYGKQSTYLDAVHGFVATASPLIRGRHLLGQENWAAWQACISNTITRTAILDRDQASWPTHLVLPGSRASRTMMQFCRGAPGRRFPPRAHTALMCCVRQSRFRRYRCDWPKSRIHLETSMPTSRCLLATGLAVLVLCNPALARVTRIVIDETLPLPTPAGAPSATIAYEQVAGRAFGELDPQLPGNALIQDIQLARGSDGKVRYVASFLIYKPVDLAQASGMMWHDVPNRGIVFPFAPQERAFGDIMLASAWQGDNAGNTAVQPKARVAGKQFLQVPVARGPGGAPVTGKVFGRIVNRSGPSSQPLLVQTNPLPYKPMSLDTRESRLVLRGGETQRGDVIDEVEVAAADWAWARCDAANPFPCSPDATQISLKRGFDPTRLYQVVFSAADPYVLGIGLAAWRDVGAFFKRAAADVNGTINPIAKAVTHSVTRGISQSGNFLRAWLHLGFNRDEAGGMVHDGMWPIIAGRRIALNFRWAQPDGVLELYQSGSEGPQWWLPSPAAGPGAGPARRRHP